jgi:hypothetical protein
MIRAYGAEHRFALRIWVHVRPSEIGKFASFCWQIPSSNVPCACLLARSECQIGPKARNSRYLRDLEERTAYVASLCLRFLSRVV